MLPSVSFASLSPSASPVHVIGASGRSGAALVRFLLAGGIDVVPLVRDAGRWRATGIDRLPRLADLDDAEALQAVLHDAHRVVSTAHAKYTARVLDAAPTEARFVFLGSTRKFTRWPDAHGNGVLAGEQAFLASGRRGVMLHPTMIYGAAGEDNVQRLAALLRRLPIAPLPGGGRALVQPIHQSDLTRAIVAAIERDWDRPYSLVVAGPNAIRYRDFVSAVAAAAGMRQPRFLSLPGWLLMAASLASRPIPGLPIIGPSEIRRLLEDKAFDIAPMHEMLGVMPIPLSRGLAFLSEPRAHADQAAEQRDRALG